MQVRDRRHRLVLPVPRMPASQALVLYIVVCFRSACVLPLKSYPPVNVSASMSGSVSLSSTQQPSDHLQTKFLDTSFLAFSLSPRGSFVNTLICMSAKSWSRFTPIACPFILMWRVIVDDEDVLLKIRREEKVKKGYLMPKDIPRSSSQQASYE